MNNAHKVNREMQANLIQQCQSGSQEAMERLMKSYRPMIVTLARKLTRTHAPVEDLIQEGLIAFVKAVKCFDLNTGNSLTTYAYPTVRGAMMRYLRDKAQPMKVSRSLVALHKQAKTLMDERALQGLPELSASELAFALGRTVSQVSEALHVFDLSSPRSLDCSLSDNSTLHDVVATPCRELELVPDRVTATQVIEQLGARERAVVTMLFGLNGEPPLTQKQVGLELGISQMHVCRIRRQALDSLRALLTTC